MHNLFPIVCSGLKLGYEGQHPEHLEQTDVEVVDLTADDDVVDFLTELQEAANSTQLYTPSTDSTELVQTTQEDNGLKEDRIEANADEAFHLEPRLTHSDEECSCANETTDDWPNWTGM